MAGSAAYLAGLYIYIFSHSVIHKWKRKKKKVYLLGVEKGVHYIYILTETCVQQITTYLYGGGLDVESDRSSTWVALHW